MFVDSTGEELGVDRFRQGTARMIRRLQNSGINNSMRVWFASLCEHLPAGEGVGRAGLGDQLGVSTTLNNRSSAHDVYAIGVDHGAEPMCDRHARSPAEPGVDAMAD